MLSGAVPVPTFDIIGAENVLVPVIFSLPDLCTTVESSAGVYPSAVEISPAARLLPKVAIPLLLKVILVKVP